MVGAMLSVTAFPVMARILQEKGLTQTTMGSVGVASTAVTSVLMFLARGDGRRRGQRRRRGRDRHQVRAVRRLPGVVFVPVRLLPREVGRRYEDAGVLMPVFASAYVADRLGLTVIVGAFVIGGVVQPRRAMFREFHSRLQGVTAILLLPTFLACSGLNTDFTKLGVSFSAGLSVILVAGIVGKWAGGAVSAITTRMTGPLFDRFMRNLPDEPAADDDRPPSDLLEPATAPA